MVSKFKYSRLICMLLIATILIPVFAGSVSATELKEQKTVRVGYMLYDGYQNGGEGEVKSGSAYEYYQKIRGYADWEYEYVYGSVGEVFEMLEKGEIDIVACVTYSEERAKKYLFSEESHGSETYFLYTHVDNKDITPANLNSLDGKKVGVTRGSHQEQYFKKWCKDRNIACDIVVYEHIENMRNALTNKDIDAMVEICTHSSESEEIPWKSIYRFKSEPLYFAVSKTRPDLLNELNDAQAYIVSTDEYYGYDVMKKYHNGLNYYNAYLTPRQERYIENCGVLKVGYLEGTNPLSFTDPETGKMSGLCAEYLESISVSYGLQFETYVYQDENAMIEDLRLEKLDIIFPLGMGYWAAEELGISLSSSICTLPMTAIYINAVRDDNTFEKIAVNEYSPTQKGYIQQHYPEAEICYVKNTKQALDAIKKGDADAYFVRSSSLEYMNEKFKIYDKFRTMTVRKDMEAFMAIRTEETTLSVILDKGISLLTNPQKDSAKFRYTYDVGKISLWQAMKENAELVIGMMIIVILIGVVLIFVARQQADKAYLKSLEQARDKAEKAERAKTEFLSQMSHDIRTPMNAIIGFTNFIKEENDINLIKEDYVPKIETASNHLLLLINDVLEMSRIDSGKLVFKRENNDMQAIIENVVTVMRMQAEEKDLTVTTNISVKDRWVYCDQNHLSRVIMNLLSNAIKFTPAGGKVAISVEQQAGAPEGCSSYRIKVADTGIGMSPEFLEKVFEPFERERTSTISGMQGTGLGMAIVKNIIDTAGDTIVVESELGKGTTFTLDAVLMKGEERKKHLQVGKEGEVSEKQHSIDELKAYFHGRRILLVEDNEFNSTIAAVLLENAGFLVETADNGKAAVNKVIQAPVPDYYDVILMDVQMPIMDGYEATKAIRSLPDDRSKIKIFAVTANAFEADKENAKAAGMNGHIAKPIEVDALYRTLLNEI